MTRRGRGTIVGVQREDDHVPSFGRVLYGQTFLIVALDDEDGGRASFAPHELEEVSEK